MDDNDLITALEANGRHDMAATIKQEHLTKELADHGRDDLAALMAEPPTPDAHAEDDDGEAFVEQLRSALKGNKVSLPGLLDE